MVYKNVASQTVEVFAFDYTTGAPKTGDAANIGVYLSKDDGSVIQLGDTSATEIDSTNAKGWYRFDVTQSESNANKLFFTGKSSTSNISIVGRVIYTRPPNLSTFSIDSSGRGSSNLVAINGTTFSGNYSPCDIKAVNGTTFTGSNTPANAVLWAGSTISANSLPVGTPAGAAGGLTIFRSIVTGSISTGAPAGATTVVTDFTSGQAVRGMIAIFNDSVGTRRSYVVKDFVAGTSMTFDRPLESDVADDEPIALCDPFGLIPAVAGDQMTLTSAYDKAKTASAPGDKMDIVDAPNATGLTAIATAVWGAGTRSLTTFGTLVSDAATAVWDAASRTLTAFGFTVDTNANATETAIKDKTDLIGTDDGDSPNAVTAQGAISTNLDAKVSDAKDSADSAASNTSSLPNMIVANKFTTAALSNAPTGSGGAGGGSGDASEATSQKILKVVQSRGGK